MYYLIFLKYYICLMAKELKMNPATFYRKMKNNGNDFSVENLYVFKDVLKMTDQMALDFLLL